jgi:hypothetical protein
MADTGNSGFQTIPNPYIVGNPIEDRRMFFGREDDFNYIRQKVTGGQQGGLIVLCGTRRSGKTSILFQIKQGRLGEDFIPILIDMQSMTVNDDTEFLARLTREITTAVDDPALTVEKDFAVAPGSNPYKLFHQFSQSLSTVLGQRKLVLLFDEYELVETHIDKGRISIDILNLLANWMETRHGVFVIFTGSDRIEERNPHYWQAFMGKALHRRISFLSRDDTLRLILEPVRNLVDYDADIPERIHVLTAGQPFYTQVICQSLVDHLNEERKSHVTADDLRLAIDEIIDNPLPQMIFTWTSRTNLEKATLSVIAELGRDKPVSATSRDVKSYMAEAKTGISMKSGKLKEALERLFHQDLLDKSPDGETYTFKMDLWRLWVGRMHSIWQVIDEIGGGGQPLGDGLRRDAKEGRRSLRLAGFAVLAIAATAALLNWGPWFQDGPAGGPGPVVAAVDSAYLTAETDPAGADVVLGEVLLGRSPLLHKRVAAGTGVLRLELSGYRAASETLSIAREETAAVFRTLEETRGNLRLESRPDRAEVALDGEATGQRTPCTLADLPVRSLHSVSLALAGYQTAVFNDVEVLPDTTILIEHDFAVRTYPLTVMSEPNGAALYIGGMQVADTPHKLDHVEHGRLAIELRMPGYETALRTVDIPAPADMVNVRLQRLAPGRLVVGVNPFAEIYIDGELMAEIATRDSFELEAGVHDCELRHSYYGAHSVRIEIEPGGRHIVEHDFTR